MHASADSLDSLHSPLPSRLFVPIRSPSLIPGRHLAFQEAAEHWMPPVLSSSHSMERKSGVGGPGSIGDLESAASGSRLLTDEEPLERKSSKSSMRQASVTQGLVSIVHSWFSRKFAVGCAILFPVAVTVYVAYWFVMFFDQFFSPLYFKLFNVHLYGLGFATSMLFIFCIGVFFSSWLGSALLSAGEWIIRRLPLVKHIYSASKQVSAALNPENEAAKAFQECVLVKHPRVGELAFGFITGRTTLQTATLSNVQLFTVYIPTNHVYIGDVFILQESEIIRTNLSVREGLEIVVSVGMACPKVILQTAPPRT